MSTTRQRRGTNWCGRCPRKKLVFQTRGDAQRFLRARTLAQPDFDPTNMVAYPCPYGPGFHIGHARDGQPFIAEPKGDPRDN